MRLRRYFKGVKDFCDKFLYYYCVDDLLVPKSALIVDIGANVGEFSYALTKKFPELLCIAIEPDPQEFGDLKRNHQLIDKHLCLNAAASNFNGTLNLYLNNQFGDTGVFPTPGFIETRQVPCVTLDHIIATYARGKTVFLLKCEAEGYEPEVLLGRKQFLKQCLFVTLDSSPEREGESTFCHASQILEANGFSLIRSRQDRHLFCNTSRVKNISKYLEDKKT